jgi:hypothetical protein
METKSRKRKYTDELVYEIINYIHENLQSNSFSHEEMYKKYTTTSATFFSILKKQSIVVKDGSKIFWIADKPDLYMAKLICKIYEESHKIWNESFKEKKQKLALHKKNLERKESAEKILKSEELELESSNVYKSVVNEKDYKKAFDALSSKASDGFVKAEQMYSEALSEIESLKVENEGLKKAVSYWKGIVSNTPDLEADIELLRVEKMEAFRKKAFAEKENENLKKELEYLRKTKYLKLFGIKIYEKQ